MRYVILNEANGALKSVSEDTFNEELMGFSWGEFNEQVNFLVREGYTTKPPYGDDQIISYNVEVTEKGEDYLENNKWTSKAYKTAKEIREWIKL
jgi:c-di-GMP-binding flagellar brake protein YcgR